MPCPRAFAWLCRALLLRAVCVLWPLVAIVVGDGVYMKSLGVASDGERWGLSDPGLPFLQAGQLARDGTVGACDFLSRTLLWLISTG